MQVRITMPESFFVELRGLEVNTCNDQSPDGQKELAQAMKKAKTKRRGKGSSKTIVLTRVGAEYIYDRIEHYEELWNKQYKEKEDWKKAMVYKGYIKHLGSIEVVLKAQLGLMPRKDIPPNADECPNCKGIGGVFDGSTLKMVDCEWCKGRGYLNGVESLVDKNVKTNG